MIEDEFAALRVPPDPEAIERVATRIRQQDEFEQMIEQTRKHR